MKDMLNSTRIGYLCAVSAVTIFGLQDGISKYLAESYSPVFIVLVRYLAFAAFVLAIAARRPGGISAAARSHQPVLQWCRGILLAVQIIVAIVCFAQVGLVQSQAIFAAAPIFVALLSMPVLGERVGWRRWAAILVGLVGVLVLLLPGAMAGEAEDGNAWLLWLPVLSALLLAVYALLTRLASRHDSSQTSFFYLAVPGAIFLTLAGPFFYETLPLGDWLWLALLCITGFTSHYLLIQAYTRLDAAAVQPMTYMQLVVGSFVGVLVFGETLGPFLIAGASLVVGAGIFTMWREHVVGRQRRRAVPS
ncbi:DMT family transporter [Pseudohoeflea coraliihabitans]|uniref:DMT family transporter n=1 Tax=Pseudohoeflea coraliihabitans TaxID=2860393 RepID=A0ABS6WQE8_9HYPH|nr:DMT family transporter [Pseudohoeflea sp. DP4N28-3]MBW3098140.1 DMT family transporter [Pseudohoeflea sp. DP4N28-3]